MNCVQIKQCDDYVYFIGGSTLTYPADLAQFEALLDEPFRDKALLQRAFVHRSYMNEVDDDTLSDNERLEFLGDSVLGFVVSELLYQLFPEYHEGDLTSLRSALVQQKTLAKLARQLHLGDYLLLGKGEEESGGRTRPVTLCATFEAVLGALYRDQGIEAVKSFLLPLVCIEMERVLRTQLAKDPKSRLQEWVQSQLGMRPRYETLESVGPDHDKVFTMQVNINGTPCGVGSGRSKQSATQAAAAMALSRLGQDAPEYEPDSELEEKWSLPSVTIEALKT